MVEDKEKVRDGKTRRRKLRRGKLTEEPTGGGKDLNTDE